MGGARLPVEGGSLGASPAPGGLAHPQVISVFCFFFFWPSLFLTRKGLRLLVHILLRGPVYVWQGGSRETQSQRGLAAPQCWPLRIVSGHPAPQLYACPRTSAYGTQLSCPGAAECQAFVSLPGSPPPAPHLGNRRVLVPPVRSPG